MSAFTISTKKITESYYGAIKKYNLTEKEIAEAIEIARTTPKSFCECAKDIVELRANSGAILCVETLND